MTKRRILLVLVSAVLMSAFFAVTATAKEFHGKGEEFTLKGTYLIRFVSGTHTAALECTTMRLEGIAPLSSANTLRVTPVYSGCTYTSPPPGSNKSTAGVKVGKCQFEFHASASSEVPVSIVPSSCVIMITAEKECTISIKGGQKELSGPKALGGVEELKLAFFNTFFTWSQEHCAELAKEGTTLFKNIEVISGKGVWYE